MAEPNSYQLSTAENELGVVIAYSEAGMAKTPFTIGVKKVSTYTVFII